MKILFIGLGSIARRHINNLQKIFSDKKESLIIDLWRSGYGRAIEPLMCEKIRAIMTSKEELPSSYDAIFITNPTAVHAQTLQKFQNFSNNFFIEKPVFVHENELTGIDLASNKVYYVACPMRFTAIIRYLKEKIDFSNVYSLRSISSSFLPEWRPKVDYRTTYSARSALGGGVDLDLIHEWDYLQDLIGFPEQVKKITTKVSELEIDSNDLAIYLGKYRDKTVEVHLDYFGRVPLRKLTIFSPQDTIECDFIKNVIYFLKSNEKITFTEERDDYQIKELLYFLDLIAGKKSNINDLHKAIKTLKLVRGGNN